MNFYFDLNDRLAIRDEVGRDLKGLDDDIAHARYLAADLRCLEAEIRPTLSIQVMSGGQQVHKETVFR